MLFLTVTLLHNYRAPEQPRVPPSQQFPSWLHNFTLGRRLRKWHPNDVEIQHVIMELTCSRFLFYLLLADKALPCNQDLFQVNTRSKFSSKNFNLKHKWDWVRKWPSPCTNLLDVFAVCKKPSRWAGEPQDQAMGQREGEGMVAQETWPAPWQQVQVSSLTTW